MIVHPAYEIVEPDAAAMTEALRAFGYDLSTAIADILDNSISAKAKKIDVQFHWAGARSWIRISDDGNGMDADELKAAMRLRSRNPREERAAADLGRFGLGLKTASFSQCRRLTVRSKKRGRTSTTRCWDLDYIEAEKTWALIEGAHPDTTEASFTQQVAEFDGEDSSGTVVMWEKLDRVTTSDDP